MSSEDLLTKFDELVKRFKNEFDEIIQAERAKMKAEVEAFNEEKKRMQAIAVKDDDIIRLNVGGQKFTTERSTLSQVEGSLFAIMFSGRWENRVKRDEDGVVFFDFNPQYFAYFLDYLRAKKIATSENPAPSPKVSKDHEENFYNLVEYLGLSEEIVDRKKLVPSKSFPSPGEKFAFHSPGINLSEDGKVAVHDNTLGHKYAFGGTIYKQGIVHLKLKLGSFKNNKWMFVGIVKGDIVPVTSNSNSYECRGSYGWILGSTHAKAVCKDGSRTHDTSLRGLNKQGDTIEMRIDCDAGNLSLNLAAGKHFHIDLPKCETWRLNINLCYENDAIRIVSA